MQVAVQPGVLLRFDDAQRHARRVEPRASPDKAPDDAECAAVCVVELLEVRAARFAVCKPLYHHRLAKPEV
eukprot:6180518-Pleurochrysis_carterae.AAC.1